MTTSNLKYKDESWDFRASDTKAYTHCFHTYPAMMIPQIARELLKVYGTQGGWLLDPYCGTGTSLVEASLFGMHSTGCDINPLVRLIATAKTTPICLSALDETLSKLDKDLFQIEYQGNNLPDAPIPDIPNLSYWFSEEVIGTLAYLQDLLLIPFVSTVFCIKRPSSETYQTNGCQRKTAHPTLPVKHLQQCTKKTSSSARERVIYANRTGCLYLGKQSLSDPIQQEFVLNA